MQINQLFRIKIFNKISINTEIIQIQNASQQMHLVAEPLATMTLKKFLVSAIRSSSFEFAGVLLATADFSSLQRLSIGFRSGLTAGQFISVHLFFYNCCWMFVSSHCPTEGPKTFTSILVF